MNRSRVLAFGAGGVLLAALACVPLVGSSYHVALGISLLYFAVLATAWALFSGPTHYISLATVAFFGVGAYTVAVVGEVLPWVLVLLIAAAIGVALALIVGLSTLRLSGIYFVIFSFGLSELIRQLVTWYEVNIHRSVGRYVFLDISQPQIYWQLLALTAAVLLTGYFIGRSRLGLALRVIGADEVVARHTGIDTTRAKLAAFAISALFMTLTGAVMAPRWTYIDPAIAFNPMLSFEAASLSRRSHVLASPAWCSSVYRAWNVQMRRLSRPPSRFQAPGLKPTRCARRSAASSLSTTSALRCLPARSSG